jgi:hypothetical protein
MNLKYINPDYIQFRNAERAEQAQISTLKIEAATFFGKSARCSACDEQEQPGHFACGRPDKRALELEEQGFLCLRYDSWNGWVWE